MTNRSSHVEAGGDHLPGIVQAIHEHRQRVSALLAGLDDLRRSAPEAGAAVPVVARLTDSLRVGDDRLERLVAQLEQVCPPANPNGSSRKESSHAHALRPVP